MHDEPTHPAAPQPGPPRSDLLDEIVERSYRVFSAYSLREPVDVCTRCCVTMETVDLLLRTPLRQVSAGLLHEFNDTAQSHKPSLEQFKYFLPRYLEHIAALNYPSFTPELALHRLAPWSREDFSDEERGVLDAYVVELFRLHLSAPYVHSHQAIEGVGVMELSELLAMLLYSKWDLAAVFDVWERSVHRNGVLHLCHLVVHEVNWQRTPPVYTQAFADEQMSQRLVSWLCSPSARAAFSLAIETLLLEADELDEESSDLMSWTYEALNLG